MNKLLLIKHIKGETSVDESQSVIDWIESSEANEKYYARLIDSFSSLDATFGDPECVADDAELEDKFSAIVNKAGIKSNNGAAFPRLRRLIAYSAAAVLLISIGLNIYFVTRRTSILRGKTEVYANVPVMKRMYTEKGIKGSVTLPDSSVVMLNSDSWIEYPETFSGQSRNVKFSGEGYFLVTKHPDMPMEVVTAKGMKIVVLGTHFHIKSYKNDDNEQATLFSGKIQVFKEVAHGNKKVNEYIAMLPHQTVSFNDTHVVKRGVVADTLKMIAWTRSQLLFDYTPLSEVAKMLERWHGVEVRITDRSILNYHITACFRAESIVQIMELLKFTTPIDYKIDGDIVYISRRTI